MANDWNRSKNVIHPRYDGGNHNYTIDAQDIADALRLLGFKSEYDYEGNPFEQYRLEVVSSNGIIMANNKFSTNLTISLYLNNINITERIDKKYFKWARISSNKESDKEWNLSYKDGAKEIVIKSEDILENTVFHCAYVSTAIDNIEDENIVYDNIFNVPYESVLVTASVSIMNQALSADLQGGLIIETGNKNQIYTPGIPAPYYPDWAVENLVIRPYCTASTIMKLNKELESYNPDLFNLEEYPDLNNKDYYERGITYIKNLKWYVRNIKGEESEIEPNESFSFIYDSCSDRRFLVIKDNFIQRDSLVTIICKFDFNDPFSNALIPQTYSMDLSCISTGQGADQLLINNLTGTSIHNNDPSYIELYVSYFSNGIEVDIQGQVENPTIQSSIQWYKRSSTEDGWVLLDAKNQDNNEFNSPSVKCYEIRRRIKSNTDGTFETEKTYSARGGFLLRIYPSLIKSSDVIKAVFINSNKDDLQLTATEVVYDTTDTIQAYITSSAGDRLYKNSEAGTTLTCMVQYLGELMEDGDPRYGDDDYSGNNDGEIGLFDYYWFRLSQDGSETYNLFINPSNEIQIQLVTDDTELIKSKRKIYIEPKHVEDLNMFQCYVVDKTIAVRNSNLYNLERSLPTENSINEASLLANDPDEIINLAYVLRNNDDAKK